MLLNKCRITFFIIKSLLLSIYLLLRVKQKVFYFLKKKLETNFICM